jgi:hypothetical protein
LKFTVTVVNKSDKPIDLGLTYISVQSSNEEADEVFDSGSDLRGPPDTKVPKGRESEFDVRFGVADPKDVVMEVALHHDLSRSSLLYSTRLKPTDEARETRRSPVGRSRAGERVAGGLDPTQHRRPYLAID